MKLFFPNGEHSQFMLSEGSTRVGSSGNCDVVISAPGIAAHHAELNLSTGNLTIKADAEGAAVSVNGKPLQDSADLRAGDLIGFASVQCRLVAMERVLDGASAAPRKPQPINDDDGRTKVRAALPKFILRGVSGATFGKTFPVQGEMVIGRHSECEISVPTEEISRRHAKIKVTPDGVMVEDLGSANGTFINDKRVREGLIEPGDELRLDAVRFMLIAPGQEARTVARKTSTPVADNNKPQPLIWVLGAAVAVGAIIAAVVLLT